MLEILVANNAIWQFVPVVCHVFVNLGLFPLVCILVGATRKLVESMYTVPRRVFQVICIQMCGCTLSILAMTVHDIHIHCTINEVYSNT